MKILLTNDDGINSDGILILYKHLSVGNDVTLIAPSESRSAYSHSISLFDNIIVEKKKILNDIIAYSVSGTPADCVKFGLSEIYGADNPPDIVISGINLGENIGHYVYYSGTIAAAIEGGINGINSIAISLATKDNPLFEDAARFLINFLDNFSFPADNTSVWNINVPNIKYENYLSVELTRHGTSEFNDWYNKISENGNISTYKLEGKLTKFYSNFKSDYEAIENQSISITPLTLDMTNHALYNGYKKNWSKLWKK